MNISASHIGDPTTLVFGPFLLFTAPIVAHRRLIVLSVRLPRGRSFVVSSGPKSRLLFHFFDPRKGA